MHPGDDGFGRLSDYAGDRSWEYTRALSQQRLVAYKSIFFVDVRDPPRSRTESQHQSLTHRVGSCDVFTPTASLHSSGYVDSAMMW